MPSLSIAIFHLVCFFSLGLLIARYLVNKRFVPSQFIYSAAVGSVSLLYLLLFALYLMNVQAGYIVNMTLHIIGVLSSLYCVYAIVMWRRYTNVLLIVPLLSTIFLFAFYTTLFMGCRLPKGASTLENSSFCYIEDLPVDNSITHSFAINILKEKPKDLVGDWRLTDRVPVQVGTALAVSQFSDQRLINYETYTYVSIFLQLSWVGALFGLLFTLGLSISKILLSTLLVGFSGFTFINSIFVWPKLYAASLAVYGLTVFFTRQRNHTKYKITAIIALTLALLTHTGILFSILGAVPIILYDGLAYYRQKNVRLGLKYIALGCIFSALLLAPWIAYKTSSSNSDRLIKWHFAGVVDANDNRGTLQTIKDSYGSLSFRQWAHDKARNAVQIFRPIEVPRYSFESRFSYWTRWFRLNQFFVVVIALGTANIGWVALLLKKQRHHVTGIEMRLLLSCLLSGVVWILLMFAGGTTLIHQGSYALMLILFGLLATFIDRLGNYALFAVTIFQSILFYGAWIFTGQFKSMHSNIFILMQVSFGVYLFALALVIRKRHWKVPKLDV